MPKDHHPIRVGFLILPILTFIFLSHAAPAAVTVDPAQPITHRVMVQPIRVRKNASNIANFMGSASSESYIKEQINMVWAQVGVEIEWLDLVDYTNAFAYDGSPANYTSTRRPQGAHIDLIMSNSGTPPRSTDPKVLSMFFVEIPAGFSANDLGAYTAAGLARIDRNGSTIFVGDQMTSNIGNRDVVASVIAHEIGHNLGLNHILDTTNLMYSYTGSEPPGTQFSQELETTQSDIIFTDNSGTDGYEFLQQNIYYLAWAESHSLVEGPDGDDDDDRLSNAFEYLNGSSPTDFTPHPSAVSTDDGLVWNLNKTAEAVADGFFYYAESSLALDSWLAAGTTDSGSSILSNSADTFSVLLESGHPSAFLRFDVYFPAAAEESEGSESLTEPMATQTPTTPCCRHAVVGGN